ncbi:MAG: hypothetical protein ACLGH0_10605 [Thermoanaerobaculia bacterium]
MTPARRKLAGDLACLFCFLFCIIAFYPGTMSPDAVYQLAQARAGSFTDWHPPLMAAVWGVLDRVIPGPFGMLLLQNAMFWGALFIFWRMTDRLSLIAIGFVPATLTQLSSILKDVHLGVALLLAAALLYVAQRTNRKAALLLSIPLLFYGYAVRANAAPAVLPLAIWTGFLAFRGRRFLPAIAGVAYFALLTIGVLATTRMLTGGRSLYIEQALLLHDLTAISKARGEPLFPAYIVNDAHFSFERAAKAYTPERALPLIWRATGERAPLLWTDDPRNIASLRAKWREVVPANPEKYLRHRWRAFRLATGLRASPSCAQPLFLKGFVWLLLSFALLCRALVRRLRGDFELVFVLSLSGFLYGIAYFFIAPACTFRFFWWTAVASLVALCFAIYQPLPTSENPAQ